MAHRDACSRGHPYTEATTDWRADGSRRCRICDKGWREARRARLQLRAEAEAEQPAPIGRTITFIYPPQDKG